MFFEHTEKGLILRIRLTPKASHNVIEEEFVDEKGIGWLKVKVTAVPENGKANKALIGLLSKSWKIPKSAFTLVQGETDRNKILCTQNPELIQNFLTSHSKL